eukprot:scaffold426_cov219-Amphora_coffeaeformis.AAC.9
MESTDHRLGSGPKSNTARKCCHANTITDPKIRKYQRVEDTYIRYREMPIVQRGYNSIYCTTMPVGVQRCFTKGTLENGP